MATTASTELEIFKPGGYLALNQESAEVAERMEILAENLAGETMTERDLIRVKIPTGGGTSWEIPTADGELVPAKEISGILIHVTFTRGYWPESSMTGVPPSCSAQGLGEIAIGVGNPGGACHTCPMHAFGSEPKRGRGRACKDRENWFVLLDDMPLPVVISLPPSSISYARHYRKKTLGSMFRKTSVITSITLAADSNAEGEKFAYIVPRVAAKLDPAEAKRAADYAKNLIPVLDAASLAVSIAAEQVAAADIVAEGEEV